MDYPALPDVPYTFRAKLKRVVDGDTQVLTLDFRAHRYGEVTCRLNGLNTPEVVGVQKPDGLAAKGYAMSWYAEADNGADWPLVIATELDANDKYGRLLAVVYRISDGACLNQDLLAMGFAKPYDGKGAKD